VSSFRKSVPTHSEKLCFLVLASGVRVRKLFQTWAKPTLIDHPTRIGKRSIADLLLRKVGPVAPLAALLSLSIPLLIRGYSLVRVAITLEHHCRVPFSNKGILVLRAYEVQDGQLLQIDRE